MKYYKNKNLPFLFIPLLLLNIGFIVYAAALGDVVFKDIYQKDDLKLDLVGYGIKKFLAIKVVGASFYLPEGVGSDQALEDIPKRLEVVYLQNIPKRELDRATTRGIQKNVPKERYERLKSKIDELNEYWPDVSKNDRIGINYLPGTGMEISVNDEVKGIVEGEEIAYALFSVWVGKYPADEVIRDKLLGVYTKGNDDEGNL